MGLTSGLLDIGDMLHTVDGRSVRGMDISGVVKLILGKPNSRVSLEVYRQNEVVETLPTPVMVAPFSRKEIQLERKLGPNDARNSRVAGVGILFHKVPVFIDGTAFSSLNSSCRPTMKVSPWKDQMQWHIQSLFKPSPRTEVQGKTVSIGPPP